MRILFAAVTVGFSVAGWAYAGTLFAGGGAPLNGPEGAPVAGTLATFHDTDPNELVSNIFANIVWGDSTNSSGIITNLGSGVFGVVGNHIYGEEGTDILSIGVNNTSNSLTIPSVAFISDAGLVNGSASNLTITEGTPINGPMATFVDLNPFGMASDFTATIHWGDGTFSQGTVISNGPGSFSVSGTHTYGTAGTFPTSIAITDDGGSSVQPAGTVDVVTPEPGSLGLLCVGLGLMDWRRRRP